MYIYIYICIYTRTHTYYTCMHMCTLYAYITTPGEGRAREEHGAPVELGRRRADGPRRATTTTTTTTNNNNNNNNDNDNDNDNNDKGKGQMGSVLIGSLQFS